VGKNTKKILRLHFSELPPDGQSLTASHPLN